MPFTTVVAGTVITSSWGNLNVRNQVVTPFATAASRATIVGALAVEGMPSWLEDYDDFWIHDGTAHVPIAGPPPVYKLADETINNNAALQNDNDLFITVAPNAYYEGELNIMFTSSVAAGLKVDFTAPAGASMEVSSFLVVVSGALTFNKTNALGNVAGIVSGGTLAPYINKFVLKTAATAGIFQFRWAQNTAQVSDTTVSLGSYLKLRRIG